MGRKNVLALRRDTIKHLVKTHAIEDHATLIGLMKSHYNLKTNQSAISRDLHQLGVKKGMVNGRLIYALSENNVEAELLHLAVIDIVHNESMIVIKTVNGLAAFVGDVLDKHEEDTGLLGTIAGENTVFAVPESTRQIKKVFDIVCEVLCFNKTISRVQK